MKKILTFIACLFWISSASLEAAAPANSVIILQHQGNATIYHTDSLQASLRDAVDGDTLFLPKGTFGGFTISKKLTIRGTGQETIISGDISVVIPDSATLASTLLEGLDISANVWVTKSVNGLKIKQCKASTVGFIAGKQQDVLIDRSCVEYELLISEGVKSMTIKNSSVPIRVWKETSKEIYLINCDVVVYGGNSIQSYIVPNYGSFGKNYVYRVDCFRGSLINSITNTDGVYPPFLFDHATFINTLCTSESGILSSCYKENCYHSSHRDLLQDPIDGYDYRISNENLLNWGYLGNDGTVVGRYGGQTPYTLTLAVPVVKSSDVKLDMENRVLNVNLELSEK